jgi:hypothetical protein
MGIRSKVRVAARALFRGAGIFVVSAALAATPTVSAWAAPVEIVKIKSASQLSGLASRVLWREGDALVVRTKEAKAKDFKNLYVVNTSLWDELPSTVTKHGKLLAHEKGLFAVMELTDESSMTLSRDLHIAGMACGVLAKLNGDPMVLEMGPTPTPVIALDRREAGLEAALSKVSTSRIVATVEELAQMTNRFHTSPTGRDIADLIAAKYEEARGSRSDVTISTWNHGSHTPQRSLIVRIEGSTRPEEVLVLGSHIDSVNFGSSRPDQRAPGADDNASGTATNLEAFRVLMSEGIRLERTLEIHGYAAEEVGLVGSADIARKYRDDGINVIAMVQNDMNLWKAPDQPDKIWFVSNNTDPGFNTQLATLVDQYVKVAWGTAPLTAGSSDHASWRRLGFVTAFPFENPRAYNRAIHTMNDTTAVANSFTQAAAFAKLSLSWIWHFAGGATNR